MGITAVTCTWVTARVIGTVSVRTTSICSPSTFINIYKNKWQFSNSVGNGSQSLKVYISSDLYSTNNIYKTFNCFNCAVVENKKGCPRCIAWRKKRQKNLCRKILSHKYRINTNEVKEIIIWLFSSFPSLFSVLWGGC